MWRLIQGSQTRGRSHRRFPPSPSSSFISRHLLLNCISIRPRSSLTPRLLSLKPTMTCQSGPDVLSYWLPSDDYQCDCDLPVLLFLFSLCLFLLDDHSKNQIMWHLNMCVHFYLFIFNEQYVHWLASHWPRMCGPCSSTSQKSKMDASRRTIVVRALASNRHGSENNYIAFRWSRLKDQCVGFGGSIGRN